MIIERRDDGGIKSNLNFFFFKQKTAYEIRNCDWSSDVCSSDLLESQCGRVAMWGSSDAGELPCRGVAM